MGYIIPFTHHTYHNYQHRMQKSKEGPHYIQQSYKAVFHKVSEKHGSERQLYQSYKSKRNKKEKVKQKRKEITEHERASLVGKGEYFHETV